MQTHVGSHGIAEAEADRANVSAVGIAFALTAIAVAVTSYLLWIYFQREVETIRYQQILSVPSTDLQVLRQEEQTWLHTYGVANPEKGFYRVPIEEAMGLFLDQAQRRRAAGLPQIVRPAAPAAPAAPAEAGESPPTENQGE